MSQPPGASLGVDSAFCSADLWVYGPKLKTKARRVRQHLKPFEVAEIPLRPKEILAIYKLAQPPYV
jgi:hypothetical protein